MRPIDGDHLTKELEKYCDALASIYENDVDSCKITIQSCFWMILEVVRNEPVLRTPMDYIDDGR